MPTSRIAAMPHLGRIRTCAEDLERTASVVLEQPFRHLAASRVFRAKDENTLVTASRLQVSQLVQQVGPQHEVPGFFARTKALMNLPSTIDATVSTSTPWPVRNSRASSTL